MKKILYPLFMLLLLVVSCVEIPSDDDFFLTIHPSDTPGTPSDIPDNPSNTPASQLSISPGQMTISSEQQNISLDINSNCAWRVSTDASWITIDRKEGTGNSQITVSVTENTASQSRQGNITFYERTSGVLLNSCKVDQSAKSYKGKNNGHEYIDLGLSVKWATMNVGASKPEDYGGYYAWGETRTKANYSLSTYAWYKNNLWTKYCTNAIYGMRDNKTTLELADDAAAANWGGSWRMPTRAEQDELRTKCTWTWTTQNGVYGRKVTGPNGNSIFLPAAGYRYDSDLFNVGSYGNYWSSSLYESDSSNAYRLYFNSSSVRWNDGSRNCGRSVRAVCP